MSLRPGPSDILLGTSLQWLRFAFVGASSLAIYLLALRMASFEDRLEPIYSIALSYAFALVYSFTLNWRFTFRGKVKFSNKLVFRYVILVLVHAFCFFSVTQSLDRAISSGMPITSVLSLGFASLLTFFLARFWVFKDVSHHETT